MMSRSQITLDPDLRRRARESAAKLGVSFAEYVRQAVEKDLGERPARRPAVDAVFDLGSSRGADVARKKDQMVGEAFAFRRGRR
jgi:predicted kinase